jgi:hypothetical protein
MSNPYITVENQTLLWKTMQRSPKFVNNTIAINREQWFSSIIKYFYENNNSPKLTITELKELNKQTIAYMIKDLQRIESMHIPISNTQYEPGSSNPSGLNYETSQSRMNMYNDQFNARQQEYTNMIKPPAPPIANFSEKIEDEAITNMDELLQQQIKQREYDIAQTRPPPPALSTESISSPKSSSHGVSVPTSIPTSIQPDIMSAIQDLTKQLAELREEVQSIKKTRNTLDIESTSVDTIKMAMSETR